MKNNSEKTQNNQNDLEESLNSTIISDFSHLYNK